ncbi:MAG: DMT family transporter [Limnochordia bacterium]|nr:DMT family transporter [Limnochordia bacterium]
MTVIQAHLGEVAALATAICWTMNAMAFEAAGKKVGSLSVNYIRFFVAFPLLTMTAFFTRGLAFPLDATSDAWIYLSLSGLIGFVLGDIFLFQALVEIGSRVTLLIKSMGPPLAALAGFLLMGERISPLGLVGMLVTMFGISLVILSRNPEEKRMRLNRPLRGVFFAFLGAVGQAMGLIFSKLGMGSYNPLAATQIRTIAALITFSILITVWKKWPEIWAAFKDKRAIAQIAMGAILGPFIGVTLSLVALQYAPAGVVSSLTSISPILIIPFSIGIFKEKVLPKEILGALISILGVILLFLR